MPLNIYKRDKRRETSLQSAFESLFLCFIVSTEVNIDFMYIII